MHLSRQISAGAASTDEKELVPRDSSQWKTISALTIVSFCNGVQMSTFYSTLWPYATKIDPSLTVSFFGYVTAAFSIGQGLSSLLLGFWMDKCNSIKAPLIFSIVMMSLSNIMFCFAEQVSLFWSHWILVLARASLGIGAGSVAITRARAPAVCAESLRTRVIGIIQCSYSIGTTIGPLIQKMGTNESIALPIIIPLSWNLYTAGPIITTIMNVFLIFIIYLLVENHIPEFKENVTSETNTLHKTFLFCACVFTNFSTMLIVGTIDSLFSIYCQILYNWSNEETIKFTGYFFSFGGLIQIIAYISFTLFIGNSTSLRSSIGFVLGGLSIAILFYVFSYPYPFIHDNLDCVQFFWCKNTSKVDFWLLAFSFCILLSAHFPVVGIPMNGILFSASGGRNQGTLMGIVMLIGSFARIGGPPAISLVFEAFGPQILWIFMIILLSICASGWILLYRISSSDNK